MPENFREKIDSRKKLLDQLYDQRVIFEAIEMIKDSLNSGGKVLVFGNGGSATQATHFTAELVNRFYLKRKGMPAISLSANEANITAIGNDNSFETVFSRQVEALGKAGDVALGLTTSGKSANVLAAIRTARSQRMKAICLCGGHTDALKKTGAELIIAVPSRDTPQIQEVHLFLLHIMAEYLEKRLFGEQPV